MLVQIKWDSQRICWTSDSKVRTTKISQAREQSLGRASRWTSNQNNQGPYFAQQLQPTIWWAYGVFPPKGFLTWLRRNFLRDCDQKPALNWFGKTVWNKAERYQSFSCGDVRVRTLIQGWDRAGISLIWWEQKLDPRTVFLKGTLVNKPLRLHALQRQSIQMESCMWN